MKGETLASDTSFNVPHLRMDEVRVVPIKNERPEEARPGYAGADHWRFHVYPTDAAVEASRREHRTIKRVFSPSIHLGKLPLLVSPRDTVALRLCGPAVSERVHRARKNGFYAMSYTVGYAMLIPCFLSMIGVADDAWGFSSCVTFPLMTQYTLYLNTSLLRAVFRSFDFWVLLGLSIIGVIGFLDGYRDAPGRFCFWVIVGTNLVLNSVTDANAPTVSRGGQTLFVAFSSFVIDLLLLGSIIFLYYLGRLPDFQQRLIHLEGGIVFDVQSISISCLTTHCILRLRYIVTLYQNPNILRVVQIKVEYALVPSSNDIEDQQVVVAANQVLADGVDDEVKG
jgi:hypothetical protein